MNTGVSGRLPITAVEGNPLWKRILSAHADSELCFCMPEKIPTYKNARPSEVGRAKFHSGVVKHKKK